MEVQNLNYHWRIQNSYSLYEKLKNNSMFLTLEIPDSFTSDDFCYYDQISNDVCYLFLGSYLKFKTSRTHTSDYKPNLKFIKAHGIEKFIEQQKVRIKLLETMLKKFNDGRSRSYYCRATVLMDPKILEKSIDKASLKIKKEKIKQNDVKSKAKILRAILDEYLEPEGG